MKMMKSSVTDKVILKSLQEKENLIKSNEFYIPPDISVEQLISCHQTQRDTNQEIVFNFKDLTSCSIFQSFIHGQQITSQPIIALITGLPGVGKSQFLIEIENYFWKKFNTNLDSQIVPLRMSISKQSDFLTQNLMEQQILEYFDIDPSELQQFREQFKNKKQKLIFLVDISFNIQDFPQFFQFLERLNSQWKECKIIISINYYTYQSSLRQLELNKNLSFLPFQIRQLTETQFNDYLQKNQEFEVRKKVCMILQDYLGIAETSTYISVIINKITSLLLQDLNRNSKQVKESQQFLELMQYLIQSSNMNTNILNEIIDKLQNEIGKIRSILQYQTVLSQLKINKLIRLPFILKLLVEIFLSIECLNNSSIQFDVCLKLFQKIIQIENFQLDQQGLKQIYLFAINIKDIEVFPIEEGIFEIISSLPNNPFINTNYLNHLWISLGFVDFFIAYYIHEEIIMVKSEEIMEIENPEQQCYELQVNDLFFFNKLDLKNMHIYEKIKLSGDFDKLIMNDPKYSGVLEYLKQKCWLDKKKVDKLLNIIKASSLIENFEQEAGNAFTILKELKGILYREDFSKIKLKNYSLDGIKFYECNFSFSQMDNFSIYYTEFIGCSLDYAKWQNIRRLIIENLNEKKKYFSPYKKYITNNIYRQKVLSFSNDLKHYITLQNNKQIEHFLILCNLKLGKSKYFRKISGVFSHADYFTNEQIIITTQTYYRKYNIMNWRMLNKFRINNISFVYSSSDLKYQALESKDEISIYSTTTLKKISQFFGGSPCTFAPKNSSIFVYSTNTHIIIIDIQKTSSIANIESKRPQYLSISCNLIIGAYIQNQFHFWDLQKDSKFIALIIFPECIREIQFQEDSDSLKVQGSNHNFILNTNLIGHSPQIEYLYNQFCLLDLSNNVLAVGTSKVIILLDFQFGKILDKLNYDYKTIRSLKLSYEGYLLAIGSLNKGLELWDLKKRTKIIQYPDLKNKIKQVIFSYDDQIIAVACFNNTILIFQIETGQLEQKLEIKSMPNSIAFSPDKQNLLVGGNDGSITITNLHSKKTKFVRKLQKPIQLVTYLCQSSIVFCTYNYLILWDIQNNKQLDKYSNKQNTMFIQAYNKNMIIYIADQEQIILKIKEKIKYLQSIYAPSYMNIEIQKNTITPNANFIATVQEDGYYLRTIRLQNFDRIKLKQNFQTTSKVQVDLQYYDSLPIVINFNLNIIATGTESGSIDLWSRLNGQLLLRLVEHSSAVECLDFSPTQPILASGSLDKTIILWNLESGSQINKLKGHNKGVTCLAFSNDGKFLASGGLDFIINIWEVQNLKIYKKFKAHKSQIVQVSFSPNGRILASAELDGVINLWDVQRKLSISTNKLEQNFFWIKFITNNKIIILLNKEIIQWHIQFPISSIKQSRFQISNLKKAIYLEQTKKLMAYDNYNIYIYDKKKMELSKTFQNIQLAINPYFISDLEQLNDNDRKQQTFQPTYTAKNQNNIVIVYDIIQKKEQLQLKNYQRFPIASCLSQDQKILALSNWDKSLCLWDLQNHSELISINNLDQQINFLKFSQKGDLLACRTFEKTIILLNQNLQLVNRLELPGICVSNVYISPNSEWIVFGIQEGLYLWKSNQSQSTWNCFPTSKKEQKYRRYFDYVKFSLDSQNLAFHFLDDNFITVFNIIDLNVCYIIQLEQNYYFNLFEVLKTKQFKQVSTKDSQIETYIYDPDNFSCKIDEFKK